MENPFKSAEAVIAHMLGPAYREASRAKRNSDAPGSELAQRSYEQVFNWSG